MVPDKEKAEEVVLEEVTKIEADKPAKPKQKVIFTPEQIASRQRAHDLKVAKFLAGGEF